MIYVIDVFSSTDKSKFVNFLKSNEIDYVTFQTNRANYDDVFGIYEKTSSLRRGIPAMDYMFKYILSFNYPLMEDFDFNNGSDFEKMVRRHDQTDPHKKCIYFCTSSMYNHISNANLVTKLRF